jgi:hypothetical protein
MRRDARKRAEYMVDGPHASVMPRVLRLLGNYDASRPGHVSEQPDIVPRNDRVVLNALFRVQQDRLMQVSKKLKVVPMSRCNHGKGH